MLKALLCVVDKPAYEEELADVHVREKAATDKHDRKMKGALPVYIYYPRKSTYVPSVAQGS